MSNVVMTPDKEIRCAKFAYAMLSDKRNENRYMMTDLRSKSGDDPISYYDVLEWLEYRCAKVQSETVQEGDGL